MKLEDSFIVPPFILARKGMSFGKRETALAAFLAREDMLTVSMKEMPVIRKNLKVNLMLEPPYPNNIDIETIIVKRADDTPAMKMPEMRNIILMLFGETKNMTGKRALVAYLTTPERIALMEWNNKLIQESRARQRVRDSKKSSKKRGSESGESSGSGDSGESGEGESNSGSSNSGSSESKSGSD